MPERFTRLKNWAYAMRRDTLALWLAARDPEVPWYAKAVAGLVAAYAFSPIDLIPDFIPVLGYLDDLLLVPAGIALAIRLIPETKMASLRNDATTRLKANPTSRTAAIVVVLIWLGIAALIAWLLLN